MRFPVIGNDVVDLADPAIARHHENERFVARVCSEDERRRVVTARDLWSLFAAKEAAYKALVKLGTNRAGFGHRAIHVAPDLGSVTWRDLRLTLRVTGDRDHVHAVAWSEDTEGAAPIVRVVRVSKARGTARSEGASEARASVPAPFSATSLATALGCAPGELAIVRDLSPARGTATGLRVSFAGRARRCRREPVARRGLRRGRGAHRRLRPHRPRKRNVFRFARRL